MSANTQIGVSLQMTADTSQAKRQLQDLQTQLTKLMNTSTTNSGKDFLGLDKSFASAKLKVAELQTLIKNSTTSAGTLNLTSFTQGMNKMGGSIASYQKALGAMGDSGKQAFNNLANSILNADVQIKNTNTRLTALATNLKKVASWQLSSSIIHGFMSGVQQAMGYAQALDASLNNIRIVTGQSADEMAKFAAQANKAAQGLSTTTTAYTDAALIYYQQGLTGKAVTDRTDATIKMANVTGQSAQEVSSQMTAIWNNFDNGSKSLEYYADVITALGASTASSSSEIAQGLSKFAAIAETTGLSYEYATSALATLVANTRQSADTIGNSLKTIFSRLQGLKLGETLDDGTDLNKYSKALAVAGVQVLDTSGELRDMDDILDDLAGKWDNLSRAQKDALAQTVGGTRQYTQLISLMDNWGDMQKNLNTARDSEGTLQEQADIYAESWEASKKRVKASLEDIYSTLIDEDFFKGINNAVSGILGVIKNLLDGIGGAQGAFLLLGNIMLKAFSPALAGAIDNFGIKVKNIVSDIRNKDIGIKGVLQGQGSFTQENQNKNVIKETEQALLKNGSGVLNSKEYQNYTNTLKVEYSLREQLVSIGSKMNAEQKSSASQQLDYLAHQRESLVVESKNLDILRQERKELEGRKIAASAKDNRAAIAQSEEANMNRKLSSIGIRAKVRDDITGELRENKQIDALLTKAQQQNEKALNNVYAARTFDSREAQRLERESIKIEQAIQKRKEYKALIENSSDLARKTNLENFEKADRGYQQTANSLTILKNALDIYEKEMVEAGTDTEAQEKALENLKNTAKSVKLPSEDIKNFGAEAQKSANQINKMVDSLVSAKDVTKIKNRVNQQLTNENSLFGKTKKATVDTEIKLRSGYIKGSEEGKVVDEEINNIKNTNAQEVLVKNQEKEFNSSREAIKKYFSEVTKKATSFGTQMTQLAQGLGQVAMGINALKNLGNIWSDETASTGEKLLSTVTALSMALPSLASGIQAVGKALKMSSLEAALLMAGIAALVGIITTMVQAIHNASPEGKFEKAKKAAEELASATKEAKQEVDNLKNALNGYDTAIQTLEDCVRGTKEWKEAVSGVNQQVKDLISQYPELAQYYQGMKDGVMQFDYEGAQTYLNTLENGVKNIEVASQLANIEVKQRANDIEVKNISKDFDKDQGWQTATITKALNNSRFSDLISDSENIYKISQMATNDQLKEFLTDNGITIEGLDDGELSSLKDSINSLAVEMQAATAQADASSQMIVDAWLQDKHAGENGYSADAFTEFVGGVELQNKQNEIRNQYEDYLQNLTRFSDENTKLSDSEGATYYRDGKALTVGDIWKEFQPAGGEQYGRLSTNAIVHNKNTGENEFQYFNEITKNWETVSVSVVAGAIAAQQALENMGASADDAEKFLNGISSADTKNFINNVASGSTSDNINVDQAIAEFDSTKLSEILNSNIDNLASVLGMSTDEFNDFLKLLGISSEEFYEKITSSAEAMSKEIQDNLAGSAYANDGNTYTGKEAKDFANARVAGQSYFDQYNEKGVNGLTQARSMNELEQLDDSYDREVYVKFMEGLALIDATSEDATKQLDELAKSCGIAAEDVTLTRDAIENVDKTYNIASDSINEQTKKINDIVGKLKVGDLIDSDKYKELEELTKDSGIELDNYFTKMADGTYKLTGVAEQFLNLIKNETVEKLKQQIIDYNSAGEKAAQKNIENGFNAYSTQFANNNVIHNTNQSNVNSQTDDDWMMKANYLQAFDEKSLSAMGIDLSGINLKDIQSIKENWEAINEAIQKTEQYQDTLKSQILGTVDSVLELESRWNEILDLQDGSQGEENYSLYADALINLASQYDNCTQEIEEYNKALLSGKEAAVQAAEENLKLATTIGEISSKYSLNAEDVETQGKQIQKIWKASGKEYELSAQEAAYLAAANQRLNRGIRSLADNWNNAKDATKSWSNVLKNGNKASIDYASTLNDVKEALADLVDIDISKISDDFFESAENLELLEKAATGDTHAINQLGLAVAQSTVAALEFADAIYAGKSFLDADGKSTAEKIFGTPEEFDACKQNILNGIDSIQGKLSELEAGGDLIDALGGPDMATQWVQSLNEMAAATGMSATEMQQLLSSVGVTGKVETKYVKQDVTVPEYTEYKSLGEPVYEDIQAPPTMDSTGSYTPGGKVQRLVGHTVKTWTAQTGTKTVPGMVPVASISLGDDLQSPQIAYTGTAGTMPSGGGVSPSSTAPSGSGGGGGGRAARGNAASKTDSKVTRYANIDKTIENSTNSYDKLGQARDKAYGANVLKVIDKEIKANHELIKLNKEKLKQAQDYLKQDKAKLFSSNEIEYTNKEGELAKTEASLDAILGKDIYSKYFDENGILTDKEGLQKALEDYEEAERKEFNSHTDDDTKVADRWAAAQAKVKAAEEALGQYEETLKVIKETQEAIWDKYNENIDLSLEKTEEAISQRQELLDKEKEYIDFLSGLTDDDAYAFAERLDYLGQKITKNISELGEALKDANDTIKNVLTSTGELDEATAETLSAQILEDIQKGDFESAKQSLYTQLYEQIKENAPDYMSEEEIIAQAEALGSSIFGTIIEQADPYLGIAQEIIDDWKASFEELDKVYEENEKRIERVTSKMEHLTNVTNNYRNILDLMSKTDSSFDFGYFDELNKQLRKASQDQIKTNLAYKKSVKETAQSNYESFKKYYETLSEEEKRLNEERLDTLREAAQSAEEEWQDSWAEALESTLEQFEKASEQIAKTFSKTVSGMATSLEALRANFDMSREIKDDYIENYEKVYNLSKMIQDIDKNINSSDNLKYKKLMRDFEGEINEYLESDQKMSEYDLDYLQKKYDLLKAQLALEEVQNTKSTVRMVRGADGNYGYLYTADQSKVEDAESEYRDKLYEMEKANEEYINNLQEQMLSLQENAISKLSEMAELYGYDSLEYQKVYDYYSQQMNFFTSEMEKVLGNNENLYEKDLLKYIDLTNDRTMQNDIYTKSFDQTILSMETGFVDLNTYLETSLNAFDVATSSISSATEELKSFREEINTLMAGDNFSSNTIVVEVSKNTTALKAVLEEGNKTLEETSTAWDTAIVAVQEWGKEHKTQVDAAIEHVKEYQKTILELQKDMIDTGFSASNWYPSKVSTQAFDTGGYTGQWGAEGKLAWLHEKELVLNAQDTTRLLDAVSMVREISNTIDMNAAAALNAATSLGAMSFSTSAGELEQNVHITAEFPNATDRNEILAAFENLRGQAVQYANRFN